MRAAILLLLLSLASAPAGEPPLTGTFQAAQKTGFESERRCLEVTIAEGPSGLSLTGMGGYSSGRSAAPDFWGTAIPSKAGQFTFEDSFGNKGTALIAPVKNGVRFAAKIEHVADPRCLPLYGDITLKRVKKK